MRESGVCFICNQNREQWKKGNTSSSLVKCHWNTKICYLCHRQVNITEKEGRLNKTEPDVTH